MRTLTVRLPETLVVQLEAESRRRGVSKSDIVRERLTSSSRIPEAGIEAIIDLIGSVDGLPADLSERKRQHLALGYGRKRHR